MKKTGIGVIGCGGRIKGLLELLPGINEEFEIRALCDPDAEKVAQFRSLFNPDAAVYDRAEDLVKDASISWVAIAPWNALHAPFSVLALKAGKHVFCEKPLATRLDDAVELLRECGKSDKKFMIGFTLRYSDYYRKVKGMIDDGMIGDIVSFEFNETLKFNHGGHIMNCWRRKEEFTGSHILEKCSHDIDIANWLIGSRARRVASFGGLNFFRPENSFHMDRLKPDADGKLPFCAWNPEKYSNPFITDKDIIDNQVVIIEYENGVRATFHTNLCAGIPERRFYIIGTEGAIRFDLYSGKIEVQRVGYDEELQTIGFGQTDGHGGGDRILLEYWRDVMQKDAPPLTTVMDGLTSAVTCFAVEESRKTLGVIELDSYWRACGVPELSQSRRSRSRTAAAEGSLAVTGSSECEYGFSVA